LVSTRPFGASARDVICRWVVRLSLVKTVVRSPSESRDEHFQSDDPAAVVTR
jgi:hypothetical protein